MRLLTVILSLLSCLTLLSFVWVLPYLFHDVFQWISVDSQWVLTVAILVISMGYIGWFLFKKNTIYKKKSDNEMFVEKINQLNDDWNHLWWTLKKRKRNSPYDLPWLVVLGMDGDDKTDWLVNAGYERSTGNESLGITFWLNEYAVIIELTNDFCSSEKKPINEYLWMHLIALLKKKRPRQPVTGAVISMPIDFLVQKGPSGILQQAHMRRSCLLDLNRQIDLKLPIWLLITKFDRLNGFVELFRRQSSQRQVEPWGIYLKNGYDKDDYLKAFAECHQELVASLLDCIHHEKEVNARQAQVRYILQFSLFGERLRFFCEEIFNPINEVLLSGLKGIWFSANGQSSSSINLLAAELARQHDLSVLLEQPHLPDNQSYFNQQLSQHVLLNDVGYTGESATYRKIWLFRTMALRLMMGMLLFGGLYFFWGQNQDNTVLLHQQKRTIYEYSQSVQQLGRVPAFSDIIPLLNSLRTLDMSYQTTKKWVYHAGIRDWHVVQDVHLAYQNQLREMLIKPLVTLLHRNLSDAVDHHGEYVFDDLQTYLMFVNEEDRNNVILKDQLYKMINDKEQLSDNERVALNGLLSDAVSLDTTGFEDKALVGKARQMLNNSSDDQLLYAYIKSLPEYKGDLSVVDVFGENVSKIVNSNNDYAKPIVIPRLYTKTAYQSLDLSELSSTLRKGLEEIYRIKDKSTYISPVQLSTISAKVRVLYFQDYIQAWNGFINQITLRSVHSLSSITQQVDMLNSNSNGVITTLFNTIASETSLDDKVPSIDSVSQKVLSTDISKLKNATKNSDSLTRKETISADDPSIVNNAFLSYSNYSSDFVKNLSPLLKSLEDTLQALMTTSNVNEGLYRLAEQVFTEQKNVLLPLWQHAKIEKTLTRQWLTQLVGEVWTRVVAGAGDYTQQIWQDTVYPFWMKYLNGYFPMATLSVQDAQLATFTEFFKPEGIFDTFYNSTLKAFMSGSGGHISLKTINGRQLSLRPSIMQQLARVHQLQQLLFNADGSLQVQYRMRALELSPTITELSLRDSNGRFVYRHGPQLWQDRVWPKQPSEQLSLSLLNNNIQMDQQTYEGDWAWLHFTFNCVQWRRENHVELQYTSKGYQAMFDIMLNKQGNPFSPELYSNVRLPSHILQ